MFGMPASALVALAVSSALMSSASAQTPAEFYKGKIVELDIGYSVGGAYDGFARMLARHMAKYIPGNPTIVPKNMAGAGSLRLANFLYNAAPKDGTVFGTIGRGTGFDPLLGQSGAQFDATKFTWIGSSNNEVSTCVSWQTSGVSTFEDLLAKELVVGASGPSADTYQFPAVVNAVLGTKMKIVTGYPGGNDIDLAMERGEVQGRCGWSWTSLKATHHAWLDQHKVNILFQMGLSKHRDLAAVPLVIDLAKTDEQRSILKLMFARQVMAWPIVAPPDLPPDRAEILRKAFMATEQDKEFLADADKAQLEINPVSGEDIQKLVQEVYRTPAALAQRVAEMLK
jgi:tripartite-type tricarboxylate transporter receptor subunit TctC